MEKWLEKKTNWLKSNNHTAGLRKKPAGRPANNREDYGVIYIPLRCPKCKSKKIRCYKTDLPLRYHICYECGWRFKSTEALDGD